MMAAIFPLDVLGEQANLLTAIVLGFGFGFALERAGFGSARKLAAQFYLHDMSVFKVMFTAILVAMVGFYAGVAVGWIDPARMWINPTFVWAQLVGGFLLGVGFIVSGLCPGTAVVSMASGRLDALAALAGVFFGTFLFALLVDFPAVQRLYEGGSWGVSILPTLVRVPGPWLALGVVVMAGLAFAGAEKLERRFQARRAAPEGAPEDDTPPVVAAAAATPRARWAMVGALAVLALVAGFFRPPASALGELRATAIEPLELADKIIAGDPNLVIFDLRAGGEGNATGIGAEAQGATPRPKSIPGALRAESGQSWAALLESAPEGAGIVVYDADGKLASLPQDFPRGRKYRTLRGGFRAWEQEVLTPRAPASAAPGELELVMRQNGIAGYFSGSKLEPPRASAPPAVGSPGGAPKRKPGGGC